MCYNFLFVQCMFVLFTDRYHLGHVALGAGVLGRILHPHQNQEVKVVPHVVFGFNVLLKGHRLVIKFVSLQPCKRFVSF